MAEKQREELKKTRKELKKEQKQEAELAEKLVKQENDFLNAQHKFNNINDELNFKSKKLETVW